MANVWLCPIGDQANDSVLYRDNKWAVTERLQNVINHMEKGDRAVFIKRKGNGKKAEPSMVTAYGIIEDVRFNPEKAADLWPDGQIYNRSGNKWKEMFSHIIYIRTLVRVYDYSKDDMKAEGLLPEKDFLGGTRRVKNEEVRRILLAKIDKAMEEGVVSRLSAEDLRAIELRPMTSSDDDDDIVVRPARPASEDDAGDSVRRRADPNVLRPMTSSDDDDDIVVRPARPASEDEAGDSVRRRADPNVLRPMTSSDDDDDIVVRPARPASEDEVGDSVRRRVCADGVVREWLDSEDEDNMVLSDWLVWRRTGRIPKP
jgi:hypothetical protein